MLLVRLVKTSTKTALGDLIADAQRWKWDETRPAHNRILELKKTDGTPIKPQEKYTVAMNHFWLLAVINLRFVRKENDYRRTVWKSMRSLSISNSCLNRLLFR